MTANFISGPESQIYLQLAGSSGEQARGEFSRELASRSPSPNKTIASDVRTTLSQYFLLLSRRSSSATTAIFIFGPVETSAGGRAKRPGEGIQVLREILSPTEGFRAVPAGEFNKNRKSHVKKTQGHDGPHFQPPPQIQV
jgi:hypothetical protein